jgi:Vitamin K-dependent gamma-carboxylase
MAIAPSSSAPARSATFGSLRAALQEIVAIDARSLAATRIAVGAVVIAQVISLAPHIPAFYADGGALSRADWHGLFPHRWCLHLISGDARVLAFLFTLHGLAALSMLIGYRTRLATFLTWALTISLQLRNPLLNDGADALLAMMLVWGNFVPWGARFSVDGALLGAGESRARVVSAGTVGFVLQMPLVYLVTAAQKAGPEWRTDFSAVYYALNNDFTASRAGVALGSAPIGVLKALTVLTLLAELTVPILLLAPIRTQAARLAGIGLSTALQLGFFVCFDVGAFPFVSTAAVLVFLPPVAWTWLEARPSCLALARRVRAAGARVLAGLGSRTRRGAPATDGLSSRARWVSQGLCVIALAIVATSALSSLRAVSLRPEVAETVATLRMTQGWKMFASPSKRRGWYVLEGTLSDDAAVDLLAGSGPVRWEKPEHVSSAFESRAWRKYFSVMRGRETAPFRAAFGRYLCRVHASDRAPGARLSSIKLHYLSVPIDADAIEPSRTVVFEARCADEQTPRHRPGRRTSKQEAPTASRGDSGLRKP